MSIAIFIVSIVALALLGLQILIQSATEEIPDYIHGIYIVITIGLIILGVIQGC